MKKGYVYLYLQPRSTVSTELFNPGDILECVDDGFPFHNYGYYFCHSCSSSAGTYAHVHSSQVFEIGIL
jgi:hypothetical protein